MSTREECEPCRSGDSSLVPESQGDISRPAYAAGTGGAPENMRYVSYGRTLRVPLCGYFSAHLWKFEIVTC